VAIPNPEGSQSWGEKTETVVAPPDSTDPTPDAGAEGAAYTAAGLAVPVAPVDGGSPCAEALDRFRRHADLPALAVVDGEGRPVGLIDRNSLLACAAASPSRPIADVMDPAPLMVEADLSLGEIGRRMARLKPVALVTGFVVVRNGRYLGLGTATGLMARSAEQGELRSRQLEAARRQAEQANRAKTAFLANMSHEIRTPLNAMMGFAEILEQEVLGPHAIPLYREYARDIAESGRHLMDLVNDLLDLSKAEAERLDLVEAAVDVPRVVNGIARLLSERAARNGVRIAASVAAIAADMRGPNVCCSTCASSCGGR